MNMKEMQSNTKSDNEYFDSYDDLEVNRFLAVSLEYEGGIALLNSIYLTKIALIEFLQCKLNISGFII